LLASSRCDENVDWAGTEEEQQTKATAKQALNDADACADTPPEFVAGDARQDFEKINLKVTEQIAAGGGTLIHCHASMSRSAAFILAYIMQTQDKSLVHLPLVHSWMHECGVCRWRR